MTVGSAVGGVGAERIDWRGCAVVVMANEKAGRSEAGLLASAVQERLGELGAEVTRLGDAEEVRGWLGSAGAGGGRERVVVAVGGDGTVKLAAEMAIRAGTGTGSGAGASVLIAPAGTMNLVAKDLGLPLERGAFVEALERMVVRSIDYASVNGDVYLHSSLAGLAPRLAEDRERLRSASGLIDRVRHAARSVRTMLHARRAGLRVELDGRSMEAGACIGMAVSCNRIKGDPIGAHGRDRLDAGELGVYAMRHGGELGGIRHVLVLALGLVRLDPETVEWTGRVCEVRSAGDKSWASVSNDGEVKKLALPLRYEVHPRGLRVVAMPGTDASGAGS